MQGGCTASTPGQLSPHHNVPIPLPCLLRHSLLSKRSRLRRDELVPLLRAALASHSTSAAVTGPLCSSAHRFLAPATFLTYLVVHDARSWGDPFYEPDLSAFLLPFFPSELKLSYGNAGL